MPLTYIGRWICYLDDIEAGRVPAQPSYHCWCDDCWQLEQEGDKGAENPELLASNTSQVRNFIQRHDGHDVTVMMEYEQEFSDLDQRARNVLLRQALYRRHWVATMPDQALQELPRAGPKILADIRVRVPYVGPPVPEGGDTSPKWERCPTCYGTGLKVSDTALAAAAQQVSDLEEQAAARAGDNVPAPVPSVEVSLARLTSAIEEINSRLAVLEKDRKEGLSTPRILLSLDAAAKAVGVRQNVIWDAVMEGDLPFVRMSKGFPLVRSEALQEWLKWDEVRMERKPEPYVYVTPPERLCRRCGEREYFGRSGQLHLCRECHEQVKQERLEEKERKRAERLAW